MEIKVLKKSKIKRNIIILLITMLITSAVVLNFSSAKYRVTDTASLINGTVNYTPYDFKIMAMYQKQDGEYVEIEEMPSSTRYTINEEMSYCTLDNVNKDNETILYTDDIGQHVISGLKKNSKCYLYFDEQLCPAGATACNTILANKTIDDSRSREITGILTEDTTGTVYSVQDDWGTSYVYAGAPTDNWVYFAGFYWRIIRINGDGSIRMIYSGDGSSGPVETGEATQIGTSAFNEQENDNAYVGYMYGTPGSNTYEETHANINDSTIKGVLDTWYQQNLLSYSDYLSTKTGFCNNRHPQSGVFTNSGYGTLGYGTTLTAYAPLGRLMENNNWKTNQTLSLDCTNTNDLFTVNSSSKGNKALTYPIGLITSDEVVLAGGFGGSANSSYYFYTSSAYWTMSPTYFNSVFERIDTFSVSGNGLLTSTPVNVSRGVRPVINLSSNVTLSGSGTTSDPYTVVGAS